MYMASNMDYRILLTHNADRIIYNNQAAAIGNCSNIRPIVDDRTITTEPYLLKSLTSNPLLTDPGSDLKDGFLKTYLQIATTRTPIITYNTV